MTTTRGWRCAARCAFHEAGGAVEQSCRPYVVRPSYESDPARLRARIAILLTTPQTQARDAMVAWLRRCLTACEVTR